MRTISFQNLDKFYPQSEFEEKVKHFCQLWLQNSTSFTFYTSGSTGLPKPISISRKQMELSANQTIQWLGLSSNHLSLLCLSPNYIAGAMVLVRAMIANMEVCLLEPSQNLNLALRTIDKTIHLASFVPNQWKILLNENELINKIFKNAKGVLIGGADLDLETKSTTQNVCQFPVFLTYGMTETVSHVAFQSLTFYPSDYLKTLPGVQIRRMENGTLAVSSPSTLNQFIETQDLVELHDQNTFQIKGRINRIINSAGLKINPFEIEEQINVFFNSKNLNSEFFVAGYPEEFYGEIVSIFVEGITKIDLNEINNFLSTTLEKNKCPKKIFYVESFLKTSTGKIDQKAIISQIQTNNEKD